MRAPDVLPALRRLTEAGKPPTYKALLLACGMRPNNTKGLAAALDRLEWNGLITRNPLRAVETKGDAST